MDKGPAQPLSHKDIKFLKAHAKRVKEVNAHNEVYRMRPKFISFLVSQMFKFGLPPGWGK